MFQKIPIICPECNRSEVAKNNEEGTTTCTFCGYVLKLSECELIVEKYSGRSNLNQDVVIYGANLPHISLATTHDLSGVYSKKLENAFRLEKEIKWPILKISKANQEIRRIAENLGLPSYVREYTIYLFKKVDSLDILRGNSIDGMVAAILYYVIRFYRTPRSLNQVFDVSKERPKTIKRCIKTFLKSTKLVMPRLDPVTIVTQYTTKMNMGFEIEKLATNLVKCFLWKHSLCSQDPKGIVACAIYLASKNLGTSYSQSYIASVVHTSDTTLRSHLKELTRLLPKRTEKEDKYYSTNKSDNRMPT